LGSRLKKLGGGGREGREEVRRQEAGGRREAGRGVRRDNINVLL